MKVNFIKEELYHTLYGISNANAGKNEGSHSTMPRQARKCPGGLVYHVWNRAAGWLRLFKKPEDYAAVRAPQPGPGEAGSAGAPMELGRPVGEAARGLGHALAADTLADPRAGNCVEAADKSDTRRVHFTNRGG